MLHWLHMKIKSWAVPGRGVPDGASYEILVVSRKIRHGVTVGFQFLAL